MKNNIIKGRELILEILIKEALQKKKGFSVIRLGDGEGRLLSWPHKLSWEHMMYRLTYWFGKQDYEQEQIYEIKAALIEAAQRADILGVYRGFERNAHWREPLNFSEETEAPGLSYQYENNLHRLLNDSGSLDRILKLYAKRNDNQVCWTITCRDVSHKFRKPYPPMQTLFVEEEAVQRNRPNEHLAQHNHILSQIEGTCRPGQLWLVGAGVLGKIYVDRVKLCGGVGIDIGSIFDLWAGKKTRSYMS